MRLIQPLPSLLPLPSLPSLPALPTLPTLPSLPSLPSLPPLPPLPSLPSLPALPSLLGTSVPLLLPLLPATNGNLAAMKVLESILYAEDLVAARTFYVGILGLDEISFDTERDLFMKCDGSVLIIFKASRTRIKDGRVPAHGTIGAGHLAFAATEQEIESWREKLAAHQIEIIEEIDWKNGAKSIYFNDPAGNVLEFATPSLWGL